MMQLYNIRHELLYICESPKSVNESESLYSLLVSWDTGIGFLALLDCYSEGPTEIQQENTQELTPD